MSVPKKLSMDDMTQDQYANILKVDDNAPSDKISEMAITELFDPKKLKNNSRIKFEQVKYLTKLEMFAQVYDIPLCHDIVGEVMNEQISVDGLGRKEVVQLVQQRTGMEELQPQRRISKDVFR